MPVDRSNDIVLKLIDGIDPDNVKLHHDKVRVAAAREIEQLRADTVVLTSTLKRLLLGTNKGLSWEGYFRVMHADLRDAVKRAEALPTEPCTHEECASSRAGD